MVDDYFAITAIKSFQFREFIQRYRFTIPQWEASDFEIQIMVWEKTNNGRRHVSEVSAYVQFFTIVNWVDFFEISTHFESVFPSIMEPQRTPGRLLFENFVYLYKPIEVGFKVVPVVRNFIVVLVETGFIVVFNNSFSLMSRSLFAYHRLRLFAAASRILSGMFSNSIVSVRVLCSSKKNNTWVIHAVSQRESLALSLILTFEFACGELCRIVAANFTFNNVIRRSWGRNKTLSVEFLMI